MKKKCNPQKESAAESYRLAQATELLLRFTKAHGKDANTLEELTAWVIDQDMERPIVPSTEAFTATVIERSQHN